MALIPMRNKKRVGYQEGGETEDTLPVTSSYQATAPAQKPTLDTGETVTSAPLTEQTTEILDPSV